MIEQGSREWFMQRCGKATASRIADIVATTKTGFSTSRANYMAELVAERLTGISTVGFTNAAMQWGTDTEPQARAAYEFFTDNQVELAQFIPHPSISDSGASPDGFVGTDGLVEIKCPSTATHIDTLLKGGIPERYQHQMNWQMACTGRRWCDMVSFDPRMPGNMQLFVKRLERNDGQIEFLERCVGTFLEELSRKVGELQRMYGTAKAA